MRLSIIIPTHRERGFIDETVDSVLRNIREDDEVLIVPNGSPPDYVDRLRRELPARCRFVELPTGGVAHARNAGFAAAEGDVVLFLDDDDLLEDGGVEHLRAVLAGNPDWGAVSGWVTRFSAQGVSSIKRESRPPRPITDLQLLGTGITSPGAVLLRRELFVRTGGFAQACAPAEDLDFWLRVALENPVIGISVPVLRYRVHDGAVSSAPTAIARRHVEIFRRHAQCHLGWAYPASLRHAALNLYRWYLPRVRAARRSARRNRQWKRVLDAVYTEWTLFALVINTSVRLKGELLSRARWRLPSEMLEQEITQRGQMTSNTFEAP